MTTYIDANVDVLMVEGPMDVSLARQIAERVMMHLGMDNCNDFKSRDKLINVISPVLDDVTQKMRGREKAIAMNRRHNHPGMIDSTQVLAAATLKALGAEEYAGR